MIFTFDFIILIFMVVAAIIALNVKDLLSASMIFGIYGTLLYLLGDANHLSCLSNIVATSRRGNT